MKLAYAIVLVGLSAIAYGQKRQCNCSLDPDINRINVDDCKTTHLKNGATLYYQFNCDSVWLTLENTRHHKKVIYSMAGQEFRDLCNYNFRFGYRLKKEYKKYLLFRWSCPANGPCNFVLIDKFTGQKTKEFGELIYSNNNFYNFLVFFSKTRKHIFIYYPDTRKSYAISVNKKDFSGLIPEYEFDSVTVSNNILFLKYGKKIIRADLNTYHE